MSFATKSIDATRLRNNAALVAKAAKEFEVATILTTVAEKSFSGPVFDEIKSVFPDQHVIDRTSMNTWEDPRIAVEVNRHGKAQDCAGRSMDIGLYCWPGALCPGSRFRGVFHR